MRGPAYLSMVRSHAKGQPAAARQCSPAEGCKQEARVSKDRETPAVSLSGSELKDICLALGQRRLRDRGRETALKSPLRRRTARREGSCHVPHLAPGAAVPAGGLAVPVPRGRLPQARRLLRCPAVRQTRWLGRPVDQTGMKRQKGRPACVHPHSLRRPSLHESRVDILTFPWEADSCEGPPSPCRRLPRQPGPLPSVSRQALPPA